jgi:hypothetical protein
LILRFRLLYAVRHVVNGNIVLAYPTEPKNGVSAELLRFPGRSEI